jgi:hypothetical protein
MRCFAPLTGLVLIGVFVFSASGVSAGASDNLLLNGSAEQGKTGDLPAVWFAARVPAEGLTMERTGGTRRSGKYSLAIANEHEYKQKVSNNWAQNLDSVPTGKTIRLEAWLRTEDAEAANVCVQCWSDEPEKMLAFASTPVVRGTQDWTSVRSREIIVPEETKRIAVRAALTGQGKAWFDDLSLKIVDDQAVADVKQEKLSNEAPRQLAELVDGRILRTLPITKDCMVLSYMPDWSHGRVDNIGVANNNGGVRTLLAWSGEIPASALSEESRRVLIALYSRETTAKSDPGVMEVLPLSGPWPELTSWKTQPTASKEAVAEHNFAPGEGWKLFDVTTLVRNQLTSGEECYGVILQFQQEDFTAQTWSGYAFVSREGLGKWAGKHPRLLIVESSDENGK